MSHTTRCEHSRTKRCRCDCGGAQHGTTRSSLQQYAGTKPEAASTTNREMLSDPVPPASNLGIHQVRSMGERMSEFARQQPATIATRPRLTGPSWDS